MLKRPVCATVILFLLYQLFCMWCFPEELETPLQKMAGERITCVGVVGRREESKDYHIYYLKEIQKAPYLEHISDYQLLIYVKKQSDYLAFSSVKVGNVVEVTGTMQVFEPAVNPGMFDQRLYYYKQDILASVWAEEFRVLDGHVYVLQERLTSLRLECQSLLLQVLGETNGQFLSAMLLGDKRDMDQDLKERYQLSGIGHVLAISGLHMSFLGNGIYQFLRKRGCPFWLSGFSGIFFLGMYSLLAGGSVSCTRAFIMYMVRMGAEITGRTYDPMTSLSIAAGFTVFCQPLYLADAGFLLSYGVILGVSLLGPVFENVQKALHIKSRICQFLYSSISGSLSIQILVFPILLYFYFEFSIYSILLNLFVIPLMSVVMAAGLLGGFLLMIGNGTFLWCETCGRWSLQITGLILDFYKICAENTLKLPFSRWITGQPKWWQIVIYYLVLAVVFLVWKKKPAKQYICGGTVGYILAMLLLCCTPHLSHTMQITMLDVGQGACLVVQSPEGAVFLVDGGSSDVEEVGKYRIEPFLKSQGISKVDYVFVTHGDLDHTSGIGEMLQRKDVGLSVGKLIFPCRETWDENLYELAEMAQKSDVLVTTIQPGGELASGEVLLHCLQPAPEDSLETGNQASMVLELEYQNFDMLLTGDVEGEGEVLLLERLQGKQYEVLQAAHHGSKYSSSTEFLETVKPEYSLISAGKNNVYGHPHKETLERLERAECRIYSTQKNGAITILVDGTKMQIKIFATEK